MVKKLLSKLKKKKSVHPKIKTKKEIAKIINDLKKKNKVIVTTNGSFDILHSGHVASLEIAKSKGDLLVVALNSDKSVKSYKSNDRPIIPQKERARMLAALEAVDFVVLFDEPDPRDILEAIKPHIHVKAKSGYEGIEQEVVEKNGGKIVLIDHVGNFSTTNLINKILMLNKTKFKKVTKKKISTKMVKK